MRLYSHWARNVFLRSTLRKQPLVFHWLSKRGCCKGGRESEDQAAGNRMFRKDMGSGGKEEGVGDTVARRTSRVFHV